MPNSTPFTISLEPGPSNSVYAPGASLEIRGNSIPLPAPLNLHSTPSGTTALRARPHVFARPYAGGFHYWLVLTALHPFSSTHPLDLHRALVRAYELSPFVLHSFSEDASLRLSWRPDSRTLRSVRCLLTRANLAPWHSPDAPAPIAPFLIPRLAPAALVAFTDQLLFWVRLGGTA